MITQRRHLTFIAVLVFLFAACQDERSEKITFKHQDNTVYARLPGEPDRLNPLLTTNLYANIVNGLLFQTLLTYNTQTLALEPLLAKSLPAIAPIEEGELAGGVAYTFELFENARWANGAPVTGLDVEFTLKAIFTPNVNSGPFRSYLEFVKDIRLDPENPGRFTVLTDRRYLLGETAIGSLPVLPRHIYDPEQRLSHYALSQLTDPEEAAQLADDEDLQRFAEQFNSPRFTREKGSVAGSGAYAFEGWETGQNITLIRKENWWGDQVDPAPSGLTARPGQIIFYPIQDQNTALAALKDQAIDVTAQIDAKDFVDLRENETVTAYFNLYTPPTMTYYYIGLNMHNPRLADRRVRRALAHLVNVDELIRSLYYGLAERTVGPVHPSKPYYHKDLPLIEFNLEEAQRLLAEAGWEDTNGNGILDQEIDGQRTELQLNYLASAGSKFAQNLSLLLQDNFRKAGIELRIISKEFSVLIDDLKRRDFDLFGSGWAQSPAPDDPKQIWHTESDTPEGGNRVGFGTPESDALIEEIRVTLDEQKRNALYRRFQEMVYEEQPYIFLFTPLERIAISKRFVAEPSVVRPGFFVNEFELKID